jgi:hypothetical protein
VDLGERFMFLDSAMMVARGGPRTLEALAGGAGVKPDLNLPKAWGDVDWDPALRNGNRWYDRVAAAMRLKDRGARAKQLDKLEQELKELKADLVTSGRLVKAVFGDGPNPKARGKILGEALIGLMLPAMGKAQEAENRAEQTQRNLQIAFALAAYRQEQGSYPAKLEALVPKYLARVPGDLFSGKALIYRPTEKGYLLYSVGANGKDEGGRSYDDNPPGDDLLVRMPLPPLRRPEKK